MCPNYKVSLPDKIAHLFGKHKAETAAELYYTGRVVRCCICKEHFTTFGERLVKLPGWPRTDTSSTKTA